MLSRNGDKLVQTPGCMEDLDWPWERGAVLCNQIAVCAAFILGRPGLEPDSTLTVSVTCLHAFFSVPAIILTVQLLPGYHEAC